MSLQRMAWQARRAGKFMINATGIGKLRVGSQSVGGIARRVWRGGVFAHVKPRPDSAVVIQGHRMYVVGAETVLYIFDMAADRYERGTTRLFYELLKPGMNVVDIGAHVGYFTLLAARAVGPCGKVFAFEPDPATHEVLSKNIALNGYKNVLAMAQAVSDHVGQVELYAARQGEAEGVARWNRTYPGGAREAGALIPATTLDAFVDAHGDPEIALLKMDIEGAEPLALKGMARLLTRPRRPKLILEFYPEGLTSCGSAAVELPRQLSELGYRTSIISDDGLDEVRFAEELPSKVKPGGSVNLFCE